MRLSTVFALLVSGSLGLAAMTSACGGGGGETGGGGSTGTTTNTGPACAAECDANKGIKSDCIAIEDNSSADVYGLRMAQIVITKPSALTYEGNPIVSQLIDSGVTMNLEDCNLTGDGTFSWLLQFDTTTGKLKTGGALPAKDPTAGYCFVNQMLGGTDVKPLVVDAKPDADGKFSVDVGGDVIVPIFLGSADDFVLLPLRDAKIINATVSADHNCIGKYNADKLDPAFSCEPDGDVERFENGGRLTGYILLEAADAVIIKALKTSLCVVLTADPGMGNDPKLCTRDANGQIIAKGDWCSTTNAADGCQDSLALNANFAASAVQINGDCP